MSMTKEGQIENQLIQWLVDLKYTHRRDIKDRKLLEQNFKKSLKRSTVFGFLIASF